MPKCSLKNCKNITSRRLKKDGISYFRFPRDPIRCGEWTSMVSQQRREDFFKPNNSSVVCSEHFLEEDMYVSSKGIKRIRKTAVPRVADITPQDLKDIENLDDGRDTGKKCKSPTTCLSSGSVLDTPRKLRMKCKLPNCSKRFTIKDKLINNLRKRNSRLVKKIISLKNALKVLKKRLDRYNYTYAIVTNYTY